MRLASDHCPMCGHSSKPAPSMPSIIKRISSETSLYAFAHMKSNGVMAPDWGDVVKHMESRYMDLGKTQDLYGLLREGIAEGLRLTANTLEKVAAGANAYADRLDSPPEPEFCNCSHQFGFDDDDEE